MTPAAPPTVTPTATPGGTGTVQFTIGQSQSVQVRRKPQYISPHTQSVVVTYGSTNYGVDFIQGTSPCSGAAPNLVCTVQFTAPAGSDTFTISAYDQYHGSGKLLSQKQITVSVATGVNKVQAVLDGVAASATVQKAIDIPEGIATSVPFTVTAYDADGAAIVGPGNYSTPIPLSDGDTGGGTSVNSAAGPSAQPIVTYNGTSAISNGAYITATVNGSSTAGSATGLLRIVPQYAQYTTPSGLPAIAIASASDGSMWVMEGSVSPTGSIVLAHVAANGTATEFPMSPSLGQGVAAIVVGPDGAVWCSTSPTYGSSSQIFRVDSAGSVTTYANAQLNYPASIVVGPDSRLWFAQRGGVGAVDTSGNYSFYASPGGGNFQTLTVGPDHNLWATDESDGRIARITTSGTFSTFSMPATGGVAEQPFGIAAQGTLLDVTSVTGLYQFNTSGTLVKTYTLPNASNGGITSASNGSAWVPIGDDVAGGSQIARLSATGVLSTITIPYPNDPGIGSPYISRIAGAADGSMWYVRDDAYGRIVVH